MESELEIGGGYDLNLVFMVTLGAIIVAMVLESVMPRRRLDGSLVWRWSNNFSLALLTWWVTTAASTYVVLSVARWTQLAEWGLLQHWQAPLWASTAALVLISQFLSWSLHLAFHKIPWLWPLHAIHHLDTDLDVSTTFRNHPLEAIVMLPIVVPLILLLGAPPEAAMLNQLFSIAVNTFSHSNVYLPRPVDRVLRWFIVTPDFHRLHHCAEPHHTDSNYGQALPWFDYLFGTASRRPFAEQETMTIGLEYLRDPAESRLDRLLLLPFRWRRKVPAPPSARSTPVSSSP